MKQATKLILTVAVGAAVLAGVWFYWNNLRGVGPAIGNPPVDIGQEIDEANSELKTENNTQFPLTVPEGFSISVYARNLTGARMLALDSQGNLWVSRTSAGAVTKLTKQADGTVTASDEFRGLRNPHGIAFDPQSDSVLYIAEENRVVRADINSKSLTKLADLPTAGGGHFTRTIKVGPDDRLYVSIGSSCNVCDEADQRRAAIYVMNEDGSDFKRYAYGLRNSVFFTWSDLDGSMWATEMGRDLLGDNIPPEEINVIREGQNYGWPNCYGNNIHDTKFDKKTYIRNPCMEPFETPAKVEMQAHSAPLGLDFVPEEGWPESLWYNLIVAFHGSWNRSEPTGYKLARIKLDDKGNYLGTEDFISGWLTKDGASGRPVDVLIQPGGNMYVSDDRANLIYHIRYNRE